MPSLLAVEVIKKIKDEIDSQTYHITGGGPRDYANYCGSVGRINGLREAIEMIVEVDGRYEKDDDDED